MSPKNKDAVTPNKQFSPVQASLSQERSADKHSQQASGDEPSQQELDNLAKQYQAIKSRYPDAVLLFAFKNCYEAFGPDAIILHEILGLPLTEVNWAAQIGRTHACFPRVESDTRLRQLVEVGYRVAICDEVEYQVPATVPKG